MSPPLPPPNRSDGLPDYVPTATGTNNPPTPTSQVNVLPEYRVNTPRFDSTNIPSLPTTPQVWIPMGPNGNVVNPGSLSTGTGGGKPVDPVVIQPIVLPPPVVQPKVVVVPPPPVVVQPPPVVVPKPQPPVDTRTQRERDLEMWALVIQESFEAKNPYALATGDLVTRIEELTGERPYLYHAYYPWNVINVKDMDNYTTMSLYTPAVHIAASGNRDIVRGNVTTVYGRRGHAGFIVPRYADLVVHSSNAQLIYAQTSKFRIITYW